MKTEQVDVQCCVCLRVRIEGNWTSAKGHRPRGRYSHTYCPACYSELAGELTEPGWKDRPLSA